MAAPRKSTRYIGLCPVCMRHIKVRKGALVHHGFERPGHGYIVGDCFGVGYPPYEVSADGARAWEDFVAGRIDNVRGHLNNLPNLEVLYDEEWQQDKSGDGTFVTVPVRKAEVSAYRWRDLYNRKERKLQSELQGLEREAARTQKMIADWKKRPLTTIEESVAQKREASEAKRMAKGAERAKKIAAKVEYYHKRMVSLQKRLEKAQAKLAKKPEDGKLQWEVRGLEGDLEELPADAVRKLRDMSGFRQGRYGLSKEEAYAMLGWPMPAPAPRQTNTRRLKNKLLR